MVKTRIEPTKLEKVAEVLKAIAHPVRLQIMEILREREPITVSEIMAQMGIEQSLLSHHLGKMKDKHVLQSFREGKNVYYQLADRHILQIFVCMENCDLF